MSAANRVLDECSSTNDLARELAEAGHPHGTWVSARRQLSGRGRLGRKWESIRGNLFLSLIARRPGPPLWSWIPLAVAVASAESLLQARPDLPIKIKWPNDLWLDGRKLGGILCEGVDGNSGSYVIIGLGLNCAGSPSGMDQPAIALSDAVGTEVTADEVRLPVISGILKRLDELERDGPGELGRRYEALSALKAGTRIEWSSGAPGAEPRIGTVLGLGPSSELRVIDAAGKEKSLFAEDVKIRGLTPHSTSCGSLA